MSDTTRSEKSFYICIVTTITLGLHLTSHYSYLLFHSLIEITTIAIAFTLFILTWNARRFLANNCLKVLGIGYAFIALIDLLHTLSFKGMNVFPGYDANLPTQLWIAARYLQAVTLCIAPLFAKRNADKRIIFGVSAAAVALLVTQVYSGNFPDCYIEGKGLTPFKINSEYAISVLLLVSLYLFYLKRACFNERVFILTTSSIACTIIAELSFTAYASVYGFANMTGHFAKLAAFYLIYRAILVTGLKEPFDLIFRDLTLTKEALQKAHDTLEEKVRERTAQLQRLNRELEAITTCNQALIRAENEQTLLDAVCRIVCDEAGYRMAWVGYVEHDDDRSIRPVAWGGAETGYLARGGFTWADTARGHGPSGTAIRSGTTACIQDFATDRGAVPWRESALQRGYRSSIALPLKDEHDATFAVLNIYSAEAGAFTPDEIRLLEELAGDLAFGITVVRTRAERTRMEAQLARSVEEFRSLAENSPDVIIRYDREGKRLYVNPEFERVNRLTAAEVLGKTPAELSTELAPVAHVFTEQLMAAMASGTVSKIDLVSTKEGKPFCWYVRVVPEFDADGTVISALTIWSDISERKQIEEALHLQTVELEEEVAERQLAQESLQEQTMLLENEIEERRNAQEELEQLNDSLEQRVQERTAELAAKNAELERMNKIFVGRELRMVELKQKIKEIEGGAT